MNSISLETLLSKRDSLVTERDNMLLEFNNQIAEIESCIELMSGKRVWEFAKEDRFDDLSPSYIKSSQEEI